MPFGFHDLFLRGLVASVACDVEKMELQRLQCVCPDPQASKPTFVPMVNFWVIIILYNWFKLVSLN